MISTARKEVSSLTLFLSFLKLGLTAFGGPAMIVYIKDLSVKRNKWVDEETFKDGIVLSQSIPGATAMQIAAYVGLKSKGITGALLAYVGLGLPAFILMLIFSVLYGRSHDISQVIAVLNGLQIIIVAIIANATWTFGGEILKSYRNIIIASASAVLLLLKVSPFTVITGAALTGIFFFRNTVFTLSPIPDGKQDKRVFTQIMLLVLALLAGFAGIYLLNIKLFKLSVLMLKINLFAFGGGFSSLPLMLHEIVDVRKWMDSKTFIDGIALGQVTPGPISITATFIGYLLFGSFGALVATVAMFTPSFLILVVVEPFFGRLKSSVVFVRASKGIASCFVGLLLFVTVKFAVDVPWDIMRILLGLAALAALARKVDLLYIVLIGAAISVFIL